MGMKVLIFFQDFQGRWMRFLVKKNQDFMRWDLLRPCFIGGRHWRHMTEFVFQKCIAKKGMFQWLICFGRACGGETINEISFVIGRNGSISQTQCIASFIVASKWADATEICLSNHDMGFSTIANCEHSRHLLEGMWGPNWWSSRNLAWHSNGGSKQSSHDVATYTTYWLVLMVFISEKDWSLPPIQHHQSLHPGNFSHQTPVRVYHSQNGKK